MNPVISCATEADAPALAELAAATFPLACPAEATAEEIADHIASHLTADHFRAWLANPTNFIQVARAGEALVGYVLVCCEPEEATPEVETLLTHTPACELSKCYVLPQCHGSGVASQLVASAMALATERGMRGAWLGVNGQNAKAIAFYQKTGFQIIGPRCYNVGGRIHDDHLMEMALGTA